MEKTFPEREHTCLVSSFYLAPIEYYATLFNANSVLMEINDSYVKQSYRNRCVIYGANGTATLSIPIVKPSTAKAYTKDIRISDHGNWRHLHWNAIVSAYNSTPFFQYYQDDFSLLYEKRYSFLHDFNEELRRLVCRLIGIDIDVSYTTKYTRKSHSNIIDIRETIHPKRASSFKGIPYYQVFADKHGFIPNLSIIDLLFNMGNESRLFLLSKNVE